MGDAGEIIVGTEAAGAEAIESPRTDGEVSPDATAVVDAAEVAAGAEQVAAVEGADAEGVEPAAGVEDLEGVATAEGAAAVEEAAAVEGADAEGVEPAAGVEDLEGVATTEGADAAEGVAAIDEAAAAESADVPEGTAAAEGAEATPETLDQVMLETIDVPDTRLDVSASNPLAAAPVDAEAEARALAQAAARETAERLRVAVETVLATCGDDIASLPDSDLRAALAEWRLRLESHATELREMVEQDQSTSSFAMLASVSPEQEAKAEQLIQDLEGMRDIRLQLVAERTGDDAQAVNSPWYDPSETEKEIVELRRARRQIRYLFSGSVGVVDDDAPSDTEVLPSERVSGDGMRVASDDNVEQPPLPGPPMRPVPLPSKADTKRAGIPTLQMPGVGESLPRPSSAGTDASFETKNSSSTWPSRHDGDPARRQQRDERRERRRHRKAHRGDESNRDESAESARKRDLTANRSNWADEVMKAALDPQNQWEFPDALPGSVRSGRQPPQDSARSGGALAPWEQPRYVPGSSGRGGDVASRARERAEEVLRSEKELQNQRMYAVAAAPVFR